MHSLQVENGLSVAHASRFSHLHGAGFELQERVCPFPQVVEERRMEKGLGHDIEPSQVFLGHVQCGFGRQPHHHASRWGVLWIPRTQEKNDHQCHLCRRPPRHTACHSTPVSGSHNDLHCISEVLQDLFAGIKDSGLSVLGLFLNADAGFDSAQFRRDCHRQEVFPNVAFNKRRGMRRDDELFDELLYKERYSIERTNVWMDSYRSVLNRFDTTQTSWEGWNYIAFILIFPKKIRKREKSR